VYHDTNANLLRMRKTHGSGCVGESPKSGQKRAVGCVCSPCLALASKCGVGISPPAVQIVHINKSFRHLGWCDEEVRKTRRDAAIL
jgi:hypothetical protein